MNNNEHRKTPEELTEEMLDAVAGGAGGAVALDRDAILAWTKQFALNNCVRCSRLLTGSCYYSQGPLAAYLDGTDASGTCPGLTT